MTVLRHHVSDTDGKPLAGLEVFLSEHIPATDGSGYRRVRRIAAVSDDSGWLSWTVPSTPGPGVPRFALTGLVPGQRVIVAVPRTAPVVTVTETTVNQEPITGPRPPAARIDLVTTDELLQRLADQRAVLLAEAVEAAAGALPPAPTGDFLPRDGSQPLTGVLHGLAAEFVSDLRGLFVKTTSSADHAATIYQAATSGVDIAAALNVVSDNPESSAMYLSGTEKSRGTLKVAHHGWADGSDASASALSVDLLGSGSKARGLYVRSTDGGQQGDAICVRISAAVSAIQHEDFVVKANGRCGIGLGLGSNPAGLLEIDQLDATTPALVVKAIASGANMAEFRRASDGAVRTRISATCQFVTQEVAFFAGPAVQIGSTSTQVGGGSGVMGITNAGTVPTSNPTGGGVLYAEGGALKWRGSSGTVTVLAPA